MRHGPVFAIVFALCIGAVILAACNPTAAGIAPERLLDPIYKPGDYVAWKLLPMSGWVTGVKCGEWACIYSVQIDRDKQASPLGGVREFELELLERGR